MFDTLSGGIEGNFGPPAPGKRPERRPQAPHTAGKTDRMTLRIRLARAGARKRPHYRIVVADSRAPRDGRFVERVGAYDPLRGKDDPQRVTFKDERIAYWLGEGARPSDRVARLLGAAGLAPPPPQRNNPIKGRPGAKARERLEAAQTAEE